MDEQKRRVTSVFNLASDTYDQSPLRFFDLNAAALIREAQIPEGARVLDVATGTGKVALAAARAVGPRGRVVGIDLSAGMLDRARQKAGNLPVEFLEMDAEALRFDDSSFDIVLCGMGIFFLPDMVRGMRGIHRVLRPEGRVALSTWTKTAFLPMYEMFRARLDRYGIPRPPALPEPWMELDAPEHLLTLLGKGGLREGQVVRENTGYFVSPSEQWTILWGLGTRGPLSRLSSEALERFKRETLEEFEHLRTAAGIWLDASALIGTGTR